MFQRAVDFLLLLSLSAEFTLMIFGLNNGLARTPPMGWLAWERFRCITDCKSVPDECISENLYMAMADRMVKDGYRDAGYVYVNIDDCWSARERDPITNKLVADPERFSHGIKYLADYMHDRDLKLGIYTNYGEKTCFGFPGSLDYLELDANTFAEWGVDSVKMDACFTDPEAGDVGYPKFGKFLNATGRPILYSCSWPAYRVFANKPVNYKPIAETCNIWRNFIDVEDSFQTIKAIVDFYGDNQDNFLDMSGPGNFNDPDMLIIGDFGLSYEQQRVQMGMWAMLAAPLLMSNDLRHIRAQSKALLLNKYLIRLNQDPLGLTARRVFRNDSNRLSVWTRKLSRGDFAIAAVWYGDNGTPYRFNLDQLNNVVQWTLADEDFEAIDAFSGQTIGKPIKFNVNPSGINLFIFHRLNSLGDDGENDEETSTNTALVMLSQNRGVLIVTCLIFLFAYFVFCRRRGRLLIHSLITTSCLPLTPKKVAQF